MGNHSVLPGPPTFTENSVPDLSAKVYIVAGASSGIGEQVAYIPYLKNAKVYTAARSESKASAAITRIKARVPDSKGQLMYLHFNLADLSTIKSSSDNVSE